MNQRRFGLKQQDCRSGIVRPADGQQFIDPRIGPGREFFEGISQPGSGIDAIEPGGTDQALNGRSPFPGAFAAGKEPVLFPDGNRTNDVLDGVVVDRQMSGLGNTVKAAQRRKR